MLGVSIVHIQIALTHVELVHSIRLQAVLEMDMDEGRGHDRLPTTNAMRIERRDAKMWRRETERELRTGSRTSKCPCTLCLFGRPLLRTTQAKHVRDYGRHPARRLQEEVSSKLGARLSHFLRCTIQQLSKSHGCLGNRTSRMWSFTFCVNGNRSSNAVGKNTCSRGGENR
jgi:hypothetical protein